MRRRIHQTLSAALAGVAIGILIAAARAAGTPSSPPVPTPPPMPPPPPPEPERLRRWPFVTPLAAGLVLFLLLITAAVAGYREFAEITAVPQPRANPGGVYLFLDRPGITVSLEANVSEFTDRSGLQVYFQTRDFTGPSLGYSLILTGDARPAGGCKDKVGTSPGTNLRCHTTVMSPEATHGLAAPAPVVEVVTGTIIRTGPGPLAVFVYLKVDVRYWNGAGKRSYFALPSMGTSPVPKQERSTYRRDLGEGQAGYVPDRLDLFWGYRDLGENHRVENVIPAILQPGQLAWEQTDAVRPLQPRGSIVDTVKEEAGQQALFLLGIGAGIASTAIPLLLSWTGRRARFLWRLRRRLAGTKVNTNT